MKGEGDFVPAQREAPVQLDYGDLSSGWDWEVEKGWEGYHELASDATILWRLVGCYYGRYDLNSRLFIFYRIIITA